ncbi:MAG: substrate-binding domain-containing protein [Bacteroidales bacterium]|nr:substrate-binding domain-containing protein [Bacteroidales bacterium]
MKKTMYTFVRFVLVIFLILSACTDKVTIGLLMDNYEQDRWQKDKDIFVRRIQELGSNVLVEVADGDFDKQLEQARKLLDAGVDLLVVVPADLNRAAEIVLEAHKKNVRVLSYDRLIKNCNLDFYISFDNVEVGKLQADYITSICPQGKYAIIGGAVSDNNSFLLRLGQMSVLEPLIEKGDIQLVYDQYVDQWNESEGYKHMKQCLEKNKSCPNAVLAANDELARGVLKALDEATMGGKVYICGQDAELDAIQRIVAGTQTMTVYKPIEAIATTAAELALKLAHDEDIPNIHISVNNGKKMVPSILLPSMVVNKETIKLTVIADGYLKENKIYP